jgi:hypothetical protein
VTGAGLAKLKDLKSLESLNISQTHVNNAGLAELAPLTGLRDLGLEYIPIRGEGLRNLASVENLEVLSISGWKLTAAELKEIKNIKRLRSLTLTLSPKEIDPGMSAIGELSGLESLHLEGELTDAGMKPLKTMVGLRELRLRYAKITDDGLMELKGLKKLESLKLFLCESITDEGVRGLQAALPICRIER